MKKLQMRIVKSNEIIIDAICTGKHFWIQRKHKRINGKLQCKYIFKHKKTFTFYTIIFYLLYYMNRLFFLKKLLLEHISITPFKLKQFYELILECQQSIFNISWIVLSVLHYVGRCPNPALNLWIPTDLQTNLNRIFHWSLDVKNYYG